MSNLHLEEGEVEDDEPFLPYLPLPRPEPSTGRTAVKKLLESSSSESDDSDNSCHIKIPKRRRSDVPEKYNVWVKSSYQEDLALCMTRCGMEPTDKSRSVESYPYKVASTSTQNLDSAEQRSETDTDLPNDDGKLSDSERTNNDSCDDAPPPQKTESEPEKADSNGQKKRILKKRRKPKIPMNLSANSDPKILEDLDVCDLDFHEIIAGDIATKLDEPNFEIIRRIVAVLGKKKAIDFYRQTKEIEEDGGLLIYDRSRKRTSGGVYLHIIRQDKTIKPEQLRKIFEDLQASNAYIWANENYKRKKAVRPGGFKDKDSDNYGDQHELENPPPSPATDGELLSAVSKTAPEKGDDSTE